MELTSATAILHAVAEYGVLGLGWVAWIFTMFYVQRERRQYQDLVIHIVQYFTKVNLVDRKSHETQILPFSGGLDARGVGGIEQLFGRTTSRTYDDSGQSESTRGRSHRKKRGQRRISADDDEDVDG